MGDPTAGSVNQEINQNMSVVSRAGFQNNEEEQAFLENNKQVWANSRALRKKPVNKQEQQRNTREWVNKSGGETDFHGNSSVIQSAHVPVDNINTNHVVLRKHVSQNNRASSENSDTFRENIRNSKESLKRSSCENILTIEENMRAAKRANQNTTAGGAVSGLNDVPKDNQRTSREVNTPRTSQTGRVLTDITDNHRNGEHSTNINIGCDNVDTVRGSVDEIKSPRGPPVKDAYSDAIDLSNNCRQFYFNHLKAAEAIKQSVRSAKHNRALEKMEGKKCSSIDNAMERLRTEMADLMDQDLSLMSQLLKLNDKIEEVKHHVSLRQRSDSVGGSSNYMSSGEISDSECSDFDDSRLDMSLDYRNSFDLRRSSNTPFNVINTSVSVAPKATPPEEPQKSDEVVLRKLVPSERDIIVYKKNVRKGKHTRKTSSKTDEEDDDEGETADDESDISADDDVSQSDTESTISYNSRNSVSDTNDQDNDTVDSGIQSPAVVKKPPEVPPKPKKGGISRNSNFMNFHKSSGIQSLSGKNSVLTLQGHHISVEKYYVPQGLVYLKHTQSENVFCQFSH